MSKVAIVGKPNVGKSTLFNALIKKNKSLVLDLPGTTRDRVLEYGKIDDEDVLFIDTGGFSNEGYFKNSINEQVKFAVDSSDIVIVLFDASSPISDQDEAIFKYVASSNKAFVGVVNKSDVKYQEFLYDYYRFGDVIPVSAAHRQNLGLLKERLARYIEHENRNNQYDARIAIVGKANVGKSSILNAVVGQDRSVVSSVLGTTTDSIDTPVEFEDKHYLLVDTAGIRRKKAKASLDKLSSIFSIFAIDRADIAVFVIDASCSISLLDKQIAKILKDKHKGIIVALNKWDKIEDKENFPKYIKKLKRELQFIDFAPVIVTSATENKNMQMILKKVSEVNKICRTRISTSKLNDVLNKIIKANAPFSKKSKEVKLKYVTQIGINPPHFMIFTTRANDIPEHYKRYVKNSFYKLFDFSGCPIKITYKDKENVEVES